jgi:hypothetical protein
VIAGDYGITDSTDYADVVIQDSGARFFMRPRLPARKGYGACQS